MSFNNVIPGWLLGTPEQVEKELIRRGLKAPPPAKGAVDPSKDDLAPPPFLDRRKPKAS